MKGSNFTLALALAPALAQIFRNGVGLLKYEPDDGVARPSPAWY